MPHTKTKPEAMAYFDHAYFDQARFDEEPASLTRHKMAQVKLDLQNRDDDDLLTFAKNHAAALVGNASFPTPDPAVPEFTTATTEFEEALLAIEAIKAQLATAYTVRDTKRAVLEDKLRARGAYVQKTSGGVKETIQTAAMDVESEPVPITSLPAPGDLRASMGDMEGEIDLQWDRVSGARGYIVEYREHMVGTAWQQATPTTRSRTTVSGLPTGKVYAFRVRALGPREILSPWSDEAVKMVP